MKSNRSDHLWLKFSIENILIPQEKHPNSRSNLKGTKKVNNEHK